MRPNNVNKLLVGIVLLQGLLLVGQWSGGFARSARADPNLTNPSERQMQMVDELKGVNARLDKLAGLLTSGDVQVKPVRPTE